jgi:NAD(P)H-dependent FMN reductase
MRQLLILWHSMTGGSRALAQAAEEAGQNAGEGQVIVRLLHANDVTPAVMLASAGYLFVFPENLAAISGVMKAAFDRLYYPCLGQIEGRPYALMVCAGSDGSNAVSQAERIATGWRLRKIADSLIICTHAQTPEAILATKVMTPGDLAKARDTGALLAAGLSAGVF